MEGGRVLQNLALESTTRCAHNRHVGQFSKELKEPA